MCCRGLQRRDLRSSPTTGLNRTRHWPRPTVAINGVTRFDFYLDQIRRNVDTILDLDLAPSP